jgi:predicted nucleic acid-binding protein
MIVVSDTTPLSSLILLGKLYLLKVFFNTVLIPEEVAEELYKIPALKTALLQNIDWINVCLVKNFEKKNELMEILDKGESAAIALAIEKKINLILIDERKGKHIAQKFGIESTGTLGILIKAKQSDLLKEIKPDLLKLKNELNFWISENLMLDVLNLINE